MAIDTIEDALRDMGQKLPTIAPVVRQHLQRGETYEFVVTVNSGRHGATVSMHGQSSSSRRSFGRLIKLK